jgi:hypothetical protein
MLMEICDITKQFYELTSQGNRVCRDYSSACNVDYTDTQPCSVGGLVNMCRVRKNYIKFPLMGTNDRECVESSMCANNEYVYKKQRTDGSGVLLQPRECSEYHDCDTTAGEYYVVDGRTTEDRDHICATISVCTAQQYEIIKPTTHRDRLCASRADCTTGVQYKLSVGGVGTNDVCALITTCETYQFRARVHTDANTTLNGTDNVCVNHTRCLVVQGVYIPGDETTDTVCVDCPAGFVGDGSNCHVCPSHTFASTTGSLQCTPCEMCQVSL